MDREKVIAWLTEISLRPCDFARDDFDAYETEHLANEALEICEDAKVFNQQRNDALELLKEQPQIVRCKDCKFAFQHWNNLYRCDNYHGTPNGYGEHQGDWFCADGERK